MLTELFTKLGFKVHVEKSVLEPTQELEFLGFLINSVKMTVSLPTKKVDNILDMCKEALNLQQMTIRQVLHIVGTLNAYSVAVEYGRNYFKRLEQEQILALRRSKGDFDVYMTPSMIAKQDLKWWQDNVVGSFCRIKTNNPDWELTTDASSLGWGAVIKDTKVQSPWTEIQSDLHINVKAFSGVSRITVLSGRQTRLYDQSQYG